jgi:hypothetical protein
VPKFRTINPKSVQGFPLDYIVLFHTVIPKSVQGNPLDYIVLFHTVIPKSVQGNPLDYIVLFRTVKLNYTPKIPSHSIDFQCPKQ